MQTLPMITLLLFPWQHAQAARSCDSSYSQSNLKIRDHVIKTYSKQSSLQCTDKCALHAECLSINYYSRQGICELNNANHLTNPDSLVYSAGSQYLDYFLRRPSRCSNKLCSYPLVCVTDNSNSNSNNNNNNNNKDYKCVTCEELGIKEVVSFPNKNIVDKVAYEHPFVKDLTAFTVSMWVKPDTSTNYHTPFSYATAREANEISICLTNTYTELGIVDTFLRSYPNVLDGKWHNICATWESAGGIYKMYIDGIKQAADGSVHKGHIIKKGFLILGQEQDSYNGGFNLNQSYQGNLSSVNMWDRVLTAQEVTALSRKCPSSEGNIVTWSALKNKTSSGLQLICSNHCV